MSKQLSAEQVLEVAERMERNAVKFYRRAAGLCDDARVCRLFVDLARWERQHVRIFTEMRERLSESGESGAMGQNCQFGRYVLDVADESPGKPPLPPVFGNCECPLDELDACWTKADVLKLAIRKEKDTISYFTGLQGLVPGQHNVQVIGEVIREEERHMKILTQSLEQTAVR